VEWLAFGGALPVFWVEWFPIRVAGRPAMIAHRAHAVGFDSSIAHLKRLR